MCEKTKNYTKIIFLDIDGVLNSENSTSQYNDIDNSTYTGIDTDKVKKLKHIIHQTGAIIVLSSSWRIGWERYKKDQQFPHADYLDRKMKKNGLKIYDKLQDTPNELKRVDNIKAWLRRHFPDDEKPIWVMIDDEVRYMNEEDKDNIYITDYKTGLTDDDAEKIIKMLNKEVQ